MNGAKTPQPKSFHRGLCAFNQRAFYEAHEHFETAWRQTQGEIREFYRAFLHLSGGFFRLTQNRPRAARKFFVHARKWLRLFPKNHLGFDVSELLVTIGGWIESIDQQVPAETILKEQFQPIKPKEEQIS